MAPSGVGLLNGESPVRIFGDKYEVKCQRANDAGTVSAHADWRELMAAARPLAERCKQVFVVHGEDDPAETYAKTAAFGWFRRGGRTERSTNATSCAECDAARVRQDGRLWQRLRLCRRHRPTSVRSRACGAELAAHMVGSTLRNRRRWADFVDAGRSHRRWRGRCIADAHVERRWLARPRCVATGCAASRDLPPNNAATHARVRSFSLATDSGPCARVEVARRWRCTQPSMGAVVLLASRSANSRSSVRMHLRAGIRGDAGNPHVVMRSSTTSIGAPSSRAIGAALQQSRRVSRWASTSSSSSCSASRAVCGNARSNEAAVKRWPAAPARRSRPSRRAPTGKIQRGLHARRAPRRHADGRRETPRLLRSSGRPVPSFEGEIERARLARGSRPPQLLRQNCCQPEVDPWAT